MSNVAILWDLENVTPSTDSLLIDGLWDHAEAMGRVVSARAYCDWSKPSFKVLGPYLSRFHFYLVHVPREKNQKNSADMNLVSDTLELLSLYSHIDIFLLVTGDSDFRALVLALRRAGKSIHIVCDMKKASQDLLALADSFIDYRELIPGGDDDASPPEERAPEGKQVQGEAPSPPIPLEHWLELLAETAGIMIQEKKSPGIGAVKIRLRMLNPNFDEKTLGFRRWSDFVAEAVRTGYVRIDENKQQALIMPVEKAKGARSQQQQTFDTLHRVLADLDGSEEARFHDFASVNFKLNEKKMGFKQFGFKKFKDFIQAAENRGLVESKAEGLRHFVRRAGR